METDLNNSIRCYESGRPSLSVLKRAILVKWIVLEVGCFDPFSLYTIVKVTASWRNAGYGITTTMADAMFGFRTGGEICET